MIEYIPYGESAVLLNFKQEIDTQVNESVISMNEILWNMPEVEYTIPAYCSITVGFDRDKISTKKLIKKIKGIDIPKYEKQSQRFITVPVCYEKEFAPDMDEVSSQTRLSNQEIIHHHSDLEYRVFMIGFIPGFPYMGILNEKLRTTRKKRPDKNIVGGSVGLAGMQTGIYPFQSPGGWQIIGRTPLNLVDNQYKDQFLFKPGDKVKFQPVDEVKFKSIRKKVADGSYKINID